MKKVVFTYIPSTPGVICIRRNADGFFYDFDTDDGTFLAVPTTKYDIPTEYLTLPGVFYWENDTAWNDGIYQAIWYPDDTETGDPVAWGINLEADQQVLTGVAINEAAIALEVWTGDSGATIRQSIDDAATDSSYAADTLLAMTEDTPGTGVRRYTTAALENTMVSSADIVNYMDANSTQLAAIYEDTANIDTNTTAILADTNELQGDWTNDGRLDGILDNIAADASTAAGSGAGDANEATLLAVKAKTDLIVAPGTVSGWTNPNSALPPGGPTLVSRLFTDIRTVLHDVNGNLYDNTLLLPLYNRAISEINSLLVMLQADVAITTGNITGDGINYSFALPANFLAPVPGQFKPRSPVTSTNNYTWGRALEHYDRMGVQLTAAPTTVAAPSRFHIISDSTAQYVIFDSIPPSGYIYDILYFTVPTAVTTATLPAAVVPWLGFLDNLVSRSVEEFAREGKEFTSDKRALWRARAEADISMILGLRHLQSQERTPSLFRHMPRTSEVW